MLSTVALRQQPLSVLGLGVRGFGAPGLRSPLLALISTGCVRGGARADASRRPSVAALARLSGLARRSREGVGDTMPDRPARRRARSTPHRRWREP